MFRTLTIERKRLLVSLGLGQLLVMPACELIGLIPKIFTNTASVLTAIIFGLIGIFSLVIGLRQIILENAIRLTVSSLGSLKIVFGYIVAFVGLGLILIAPGSLKATIN